jgi:peptidoglycan hydrolase-like protein with peptidoglycan-binding domain
MTKPRVSEHDFEMDDRPARPRAHAVRASTTSLRDDGPGRKASRRPKIITKGRIFASLAVLGGGIIIANAVLFQTERHPAPMFSPMTKQADAFPMPPVRPEAYGKNVAFEARPLAGVKPGQPAQQAAAPAPTPAPVSATPAARPQPAIEQPTEALLTEIQRELAKRGHYKGEPTGKMGPTTTQAIRDFQFAQRVAVDGKPSEQLLRDIMAVKVTMKDELMDLVKRASTDERPQRTVLDVQRALNKAGYGPISEDGQWGPSTRTALTRFEQDKKLPARGEPKGPVLRALASASGLTISQ